MSWLILAFALAVLGLVVFRLVLTIRHYRALKAYDERLARELRHLQWQ